MFTTMLEGSFSKIRSRFPNMIREEDAGLRDKIYYLYDDPKASYIQLLVAARKTEMEASNMKVVMAKVSSLGGSHKSEIKALIK